ncbi:MAG: ATP-binding protein [Candidatus Omnitrophica bacterium]|nr:ATP-binding protein [Candidatus Omnitrophota bacterium]
MIDTYTFTQSKDIISVQPSDNIFKELGNNTYDFKDLISELIDNSIAAGPKDKQIDVKIIVYVDEQNNPTDFVITDNASGIPQDLLGKAISPAGIQTKNSLNEHGLGMKQAVAALGELKYLATKVAGEKKARIITVFKFGSLKTYNADFNCESGTEICVTNIKSIVLTNATAYTRSLVPYLGARYRRLLKPENKKLNLTVSIVKKQTDDVLYTWSIAEIKPVYFHPSTRENRPVILKHLLKGQQWKAELTFGYAPKDKAEYEELGLEQPNKFHPYNVSLSRQGLDVILHDRAILFHQLSELEIIMSKHSDYNSIRGEINLIVGFSTAITKNSIIYDSNFKECIEEITQILNGQKEGPNKNKQNYLKTKTYPEEIPEKLLRDRLIEWLVNNPMSKKQNVNKEFVVWKGLKAILIYWLIKKLGRSKSIKLVP